MFRSVSRLCRRAALLTALLILTLTAFASPALAREAFTIRDYRIDVRVQDDTSVEISEVILADFHEVRHGIYRSLPARLGDYTVGIRDIRVTGVPYDTSYENGYMNIRIGDPDRTVTGLQEYRISYTMIFNKAFLADPEGRFGERMYLNLIGSQWDTDIESATFSVDMGKSFDPSGITVTSGPVGTETNEYAQWETEGTRIYGSLERPLGPYESLTVHVSLPDNWYSGYQEAGGLLGALTGPGALGLAALSLFIWFRKGRDRHLVVTPEFYPPDNMSPAEVGYILDHAADPLDITSLIIWWASQGYLQLTELGKKNFRLTRLKDLPDTGRPFETYFFNQLFDSGRRDQIELKDLEGSFYTEMTTATGLLSSYFNDEPSRRLKEGASSALSGLVIFLSLLPLLALGFFSALRAGNGLWTVLVILGGLALSIPGWIGITMILYALLHFRVLPRSRFAGALFTGLIFALPGLGVLLYFSTRAGAGLLGITVIAAVVLTNLLGHLTTRRSQYGDQVTGRVLGFRRFLLTAEKSRIERLLEENPSYFYDILPYAQVLRVTRRWTKKFAGLEMSPPDWYQGKSNMSTFNAMVFAHSMNHSFRSVSTGLSHNPQAHSGGSGFGGGGFSGGGGGGGGGGSW